jgi:hypothetical protein
VSSSASSVRHCINCGVDHETRNFLRATFLKILDYIEISPDYIKILRDNKILNNSGYEIYEEASKSFSTKETALKEILSSFIYSKEDEEKIVRDATPYKELIAERQSTLPKSNVEVEGDLWFQDLPRRGKLMVEHILSEKPEMSKLQLMEMVQPRVKARRVLDAILGVGKDLAVRFTPEIYHEYLESTRQRDYENRPEIRKKRNKRRQAKKRAKLR